MTSDILSNREIRRFANQIALSGIGLKGQEKIKQAKVVVIGTGGIGTVVMQHLVAAGIGTLGIIDNAMVEESNIHRQTVYGTSDLGKQKAIIAKQKLGELNSQVQLNIHNLCISFGNLKQICSSYDLVIDASNNWEANVSIWKYCEDENKKVIFARAVEYLVEIGVFTNGGELKKQMETFTKFDKKEGFFSAIGGFAGSILALEVIKLIAAKKENEKNLVSQFDLANILQ